MAEIVKLCRIFYHITPLGMKKICMRLIYCIAALLFAVPHIALAHPGHETMSFGFLHLITNFDHVMQGAGLLLALGIGLGIAAAVLDKKMFRYAGAAIFGSGIVLMIGSIT